MIKIFENVTELDRFARDLAVEIAKESIDAKGVFNILLCGGSTPKAIYEMLSNADLDWAKCRIFLGDERMVPADEDQSNYKMISNSLILPANIPEENVFRWITETGDASVAAEDYNNKISAYFNGEPIFDLTFLGLGDDAHTASLFPNSPALKEINKFATENWVDKFDSFRLTTTFALINNSRNIAFLVSGANKADALNTVLNVEQDHAQYPAQQINPTNGTLYWLVDGAAAKQLNQK